MSRTNKKFVKNIVLDDKYNDKVVTKLINQIMVDGKKSLATKIVYESFNNVETKLKTNIVDALKQIMHNIMPLVEVKAKRLGGANYQVPVEVNEERKITLGIRWLVNATRNRQELTMIERLTAELIDAYNNVGNTVKKKEDVYRMAEANKAFAFIKF